MFDLDAWLDGRVGDEHRDEAPIVEGREPEAADEHMRRQELDRHVVAYRHHPRTPVGAVESAGADDLAFGSHPSMVFGAQAAQSRRARATLRPATP